MVTAQLTPVGVGIHNVLIATDFSTYSNTALRYGLQLAKSYEATAHVVFVVPADEFLIAGPEAYVAAKEAAARDLEELKAELGRKHSYVEGRDYHLCLLEGDVAQTIIDFTRNQRIDLIVLGTHGRGGLGKALMGSVAEKVFRQSPVPVLTLGPQSSPRDPRSQPAQHPGSRRPDTGFGTCRALRRQAGWRKPCQAHAAACCGSQEARTRCPTRLPRNAPLNYGWKSWQDVRARASKSRYALKLDE